MDFWSIHFSLAFTKSIANWRCSLVRQDVGIVSVCCLFYQQNVLCKTPILIDNKKLRLKKKKKK